MRTIIQSIAGNGRAAHGRLFFSVAMAAVMLPFMALAPAAASPLPPPQNPAVPTQSYAPIVDRVAPAVVTIRSERRVRMPQQFPFSDDPFFGQLFGDRFRNAPRQDRQQTQRALGSGVIVSADGYILTNHHVVDGAENITVEMTDRRTFPAKLIGSDAPSDLALLKIEATGLPTLTLGDSDKVRVGDICLAVGNPLGIGETVTAGIISARGRATGLSDGSFEDFLQTDAAINQGNSGGALVSTHGELIGINSQILSPSGGNIGIGFAIPSNMARSVMDQLKNGGKVRRSKLGVNIQDITSDLAKTMELKEVRGVLVSSVEPGSPGEKAGLRAGDVITAVNGARMDDMNTLRNRIASTPPGTEVTLSVIRDGKQEQFHARLEERDMNEETATASGGGGPEGRGGQLGISVAPLTADRATQLGLRRGTQGVVVTDVDPTSPAAQAGIQPDDVITEVNRQPVKSAADFRAALRNSGSRPVLLLINRDGRTVFMAVQPR